MVEQVIDPIRMPIITLSQAELDEIEAMVAGGSLPADFLDRYYTAVENNVFGYDHKKDRHGNPIEQGRGSAGNQTSQSVEAYKKWGKDEPNYAENLKVLQEQLAACHEVREAAGAARRKRGGARR